MITDFRNKLNFEPKQVKFIEKVYNLKTDHKTGLLLQELFKNEADSETDTKMLKLVLGEKQYKELMEELEEAGAEQGAVNYTENIQAIIFGIMSVLYNKPYEDFLQATEKVEKKQKATMTQWKIMT